MNSKSSKNSFRNIHTKKQKNTNNINTTNKSKNQKNFNITTTMLEEIKSNIYLSTINNNVNNKHNSEILTTICDKLFIIINHVIIFFQQLSTNNKTQTIESLTSTTKDTLLNEIHSLFNFLSFNINNSKEIEFTIQNSNQFTLCDKQRHNSQLFSNDIEMLSNENIIEKIKEKINLTKSKPKIQVYKSTTKGTNLKPMNINECTPQINLYKSNSIYKNKEKSNNKLKKKKTKKNNNNIETTIDNNNNHTITPIKTKKKRILRLFKKKSEPLYKQFSKELGITLNATCSLSNKKQMKKRCDSFSSDNDYSLNDSFVTFTSDKIKQRFFTRYPTLMVGPKPTLYTAYLMNKSRDIIDNYHKEKQKNQYQNDSHSFTEANPNLITIIKRPLSTMQKYKHTFSKLFLEEQ
jgi:hypothetical protein